MKKLFYTVAILAAFASCSKTEGIQQAPEEGKAIEFNTLRDVAVSRAATNTGDNYTVYAQYTTATSGWYFSAYNLKGLDNTPVTSGAVYYWPSKPLDFVAFAPYATKSGFEITATPTAPVTSGAKGKMKLDFNVKDGKTDFTVATATDKSSGAAVALSFGHVLTKVDISVELSAAYATAGYEIVGTPVVNFTPAVNKASITDAVASIAIASPSADAVKPVYTTNSTLAASKTSSTPVTFYILPHTAAQNLCVVEITGLSTRKTDGTATSALTLKKTFAANAQAFDQGTQYNLKWTVAQPDAIEFTSTPAIWTSGADVTL